MIDAIQRLLPFLPTLPFWAKIALSVAFAAIFFCAIAIMWSKPTPTLEKVPLQEVDNLLIELSDIRARYPDRAEEIEPLADRAVALIGAGFPDQAATIQDAKENSKDLLEVARTVKTQLQIVKAKLPQGRN